MTINRLGHSGIQKQHKANKAPKKQPTEQQPTTPSSSLQRDAMAMQLPGLDQSGTLRPLNLQNMPILLQDTSPDTSKLDPVSKRIHILAQQNLPDDAQQLADQLLQAQPDSMEAAQTLFQIFSMWTGSQQDLQTFALLNQKRTLDSHINSLKDQMANADPKSPDTQQMQDQLDNLSSLKQSLSTTIKMSNPAQNGRLQKQLRHRLKNAAPGSTEAAHLRAQLYAVTSNQKNFHLTSQMQTMVQNGLPKAQDLQTQLDTADPSSPEAQQLKAKMDFLAQLTPKKLDQILHLDQGSPEAAQYNLRIATLWSGSPQDLQKFQTFGALRQVNSQAININTMLANLAPSSKEAKQLKTQLDGIRKQRQSLNQTIEHLNGSSKKPSTTNQ